MINRNKKILLLFCTFFLLSNFGLVMAQDVMFTPQIEIPDSEFEVGKQIEVSGKTFIEYIIAIYKWSVSAIAIIAIIMIMIAGFQWMAAAGNPSAIGQARARINSSLIGLLLAVGAYSLLNFINPSLVNLRGLDLEGISRVDLNISEKTCTTDGYVVYNWSNFYKCFDMRNGHNMVNNYTAVGDMGIMDTIEKGDIRHISIDLGVDENHAEGRDCDVKNDFEDIDKRVRGYEIDETEECQGAFTSEKWSVCLADGGSCDNSADNFYDYIPNSGAGIMATVFFDDNDNFEGIEVKTVSQDSSSSAFFSNVKIITTTHCILCCEGSEGAFFVNGFDCRAGSSPVSLYSCCLPFCEDAYSRFSCNQMSSYCGMPCYWRSGQEQGMEVGGFCLEDENY